MVPKEVAVRGYGRNDEIAQMSWQRSKVTKPNEKRLVYNEHPPVAPPAVEDEETLWKAFIFGSCSNSIASETGVACTENTTAGKSTTVDAHGPGSGCWSMTTKPLLLNDDDSSILGSLN